MSFFICATYCTLSGALDSPLTDYGKSQIELVCSIFEREPNLPSPLKVYVSPLGRTIETAKILSHYIEIEIIKENRLREVSLGSWDGMTRDEIEKNSRILLIAQSLIIGILDLQTENIWQPLSNV